MLMFFVYSFPAFSSQFLSMNLCASANHCGDNVEHFDTFVNHFDTFLPSEIVDFFLVVLVFNRWLLTYGYTFVLGWRSFLYELTFGWTEWNVDWNGIKNGMESEEL